MGANLHLVTSRPTNIPRSMRETPRWVTWKAVPSKRRPGGFDKIPTDPRTGKPFPKGSDYLHSPKLWTTHDEAANTGQPLGFILGGGFAGVDLDDVITDGRLAPWAGDLIARFGTYTEISPSGAGVKLFLRGRIDGDLFGKRAGVEIYDRDRFFTVTGNSLPQCGDEVQECSDQLQHLYDTLKRGDVLEVLKLRGFVLGNGKPRSNGFVDIACPWATPETAEGGHTGVHVDAQGQADGFRCFHASHEDKTIGDLRKWLNLPSSSLPFVRTDKGAIVPGNPTNIRLAVEGLGATLRYDAFAQKPLIQWGHGPEVHLEDPVANQLRFAIHKRYGFLPTKDTYTDLLEDLARKSRFHPVQDYLAGLRWDGIARIDQWLTTYGGAEDSAYTRAVASIVLMAAVRRVRQPGCKFDELLVLISRQGTLKSSALRALCPNAAWFTDDLPLGVSSKEVIERTGGKWLIEAGELQGFGRRDAEQLKAFLSRQVDGPVRLAYGRLPLERPRQFINVGTTNAEQFLQDWTGNRRYWPIRVSRFDVDALVRDRDQLWAEAAHREAAGESIRLSPFLYSAATQAQETRLIEDPWYDILRTEFVDHVDGVRDRIPLDVVWTHLNIPLERRDAKANHRVIQVMQALGYERRNTRVDGKQLKCWRTTTRLALEDEAA